MRFGFDVVANTAVIALASAGLVACTGASGGPGPAPQIAPQTGDPSPAAVDVGRAVNAFTVDLWKRLPHDGNAAASPFGVAGALAMAYVGARGGTSAEMAKVVGFHADLARHDDAWRDFLAATAGTQARGGVTLAVANGLWVQKGVEILAPFRASLVANHGAEPWTVDFARAPAKAIAEINAWTSDRTGAMIRELLHEGDVDPLTRLVLTNAVHFKGRWDDEFDVGRTAPADFRGPAGKRQVPTMKRHADCGFARLPGVKLLELDYKGRDASMVLVLPDADDGLPAVEASLTVEQFEGWLKKVEGHGVDVALPRFKVSARLALAPTLAEMGMSTAVTAAADFSGIDGAKNLFLGSVVHEAVVVVDEKGTEAAAATGAVLFPTSREERERYDFLADHPFLFFVRDRRTGAILFVGRVVDPQE